jgi:hypothetical protein
MRLVHHTGHIIRQATFQINAVIISNTDGNMFNHVTVFCNEFLAKRKRVFILCSFLLNILIIYAENYVRKKGKIVPVLN